MAFWTLLRTLVHYATKGANIGNNTAIIKPFWIKLRRAPKRAPFDPTIVINGMHLANPAAIIYECMTDTTWGMAAPDSIIDQDSFAAAATKLKAEGLGLSMLWHKQESIEDFVGTVIDHMEASLALDPFTGKFRLKLIRDDYDPETLPVFGPHNAKMTRFERRAWGETVNEITVSWTNPVNEQTETVTVHDTANLSVQGGGVVGETHDYSGVRTAELALRLATRDLLAGSSALATAELLVNRAAWRILPGDVIKLDWPEHGVAGLPMRAGEVNYGAPGDSTIRISLVEDVFGSPDSSWVSSDGTAWVDPARAPQPLEFSHLTSMPYYLLALVKGGTQAAATADTADFDMAFGTHLLQSIYNYDLVTESFDTEGNSVWISRDRAEMAGRGELGSDIVAAATTLVPTFVNMRRPEYAAPGALVWLGPIDRTGELAVLTSVDATGYTLARGVLDTVPANWPAGTPVWFLTGECLSSTRMEREVGEVGIVRFLTTSALGRLAVEDAPDVTATMSGRLHRPYRPANFAADGVLFPAIPPKEPVTLTWAGRNRLDETSQVYAWEDAAVTPEPGVTYTLEVDALTADGTLIEANYHVETGLTVESFIFDSSAYLPPGGTGLFEVRLWSVRDGLASWQAATQRIAPVFTAPYNLAATFTAT